EREHHHDARGDHPARRAAVVGKRRPPAGTCLLLRCLGERELLHFASGQVSPLAASGPMNCSNSIFPRHSWCLRNSSVNADHSVVGPIWKLVVAIAWFGAFGTPALGSTFAGS